MSQGSGVALGIPALPPPVLAGRRATRQLRVGAVGVGSDHPVSVQSMTTTLTADVDATLQQIAELTATGCDIVRVAVPSADDAEALAPIARKSQIPVIADIHFQPKYVFAAIAAGCAAVRVNPGNIKKCDDRVGETTSGDARVMAPIFMDGTILAAVGTGRRYRPDNGSMAVRARIGVVTRLALPPRTPARMVSR